MADDASLPADIESKLYEAFFESQGAERETAIDAVLAAHPEHADSLRSILAELEAGDRVFAEAIDTPSDGQIGPYKLGRKLGEGGFGVVFHAEQEEPIAREVALKLIRPGMDSESVVARFDAERRVLARLDHPSIARVLDAGVTESGSPWFVMEYVPGAPITRYCDDNRLDVRTRLELFVEVCDAVQHAHQRGILHRDLKPSNVLVRVHDGKALPKIIDFGIAKALHAQDGSGANERGRLLGTPEYMSPEQAEGSLDIDIRADVYSLGMLLYVLLTGRMPFDHQRVRRGSSEEIARFLREHDIPKPSTRVGSGEDSDSIAARRRLAAPDLLVSALRGELDWIAMKAIDRDRTQRYDTVAALADDVRRYLGGDPVLAGPGGRAYVARKFLRKNRVAVAAASFVLLALLGGLVASILLWQRAVGAEHDASESARLAQESERKALQNAKQAAANAETAEANAKAARASEARAKANELKAQSYLSDFRSLADRLELAELVRQQEALWPEHPRLVASMEAWLRRAKTLAAKRDDCARKLESLRKRSGKKTEDGWSYNERSDRFLDESLALLKRDLERFADAKSGYIRDVEARLEQARSIERRTIDDRTIEWRNAIAAIRKDERYKGLDLVPQIGLVPIGPDPETGLQEFAHLRSGRVPLRDAQGRLQRTTDMSIVLVLLPAARFAFGAQSDDPEKPNFEARPRDYETPVKVVELDAFFYGKFEMTQAQWRAWTGKNPSRYHARGTFGNVRVSWLHPVENVTWTDAHRVMTQLGLQLPTEAQWEYACRAGTTSANYRGDKIHDLQGFENLADEPSGRAGFLGPVRPIIGYRDKFGPHAPVGTYRANPFGIHDAIGNVAEWCRDRFAPASDTPRKGDGLRQGRPNPRKLRMFRGGSFGSNERGLRTGMRSPIDESGRAGPLGLRAARAIGPGSSRNKR